MRCKQCGGDNDERATQCGYCDAALRRPYPYDPLGQWLGALEEEKGGAKADDGQTQSWVLQLVVYTLLPLVILPVGGTIALAVTGVLRGWLPITLFGLGAACICFSGIFTWASTVGDAAAWRETYRAVYGDEIEAYRREAGIEPWRMVVLVAEAMPKRSFLRSQMLDALAERPRDGGR